jgi:antitoxin component of MazEF toxin-antitoxin module
LECNTMLDVTIRKIGGSLYALVPGDVAAMVGLREGAIVTVQATGNGVAYSTTGRMAAPRGGTMPGTESTEKDREHIRRLAKAAGIDMEGF